MQRIFVGFACDNRCVFCAQGALRERALEHAVEAELGEVEPGRALSFVGGEPLLHTALPSWLRLARERGVTEIVVQTNGRRLSVPGRAIELAEAGLTRLDVSLHGSTAPMHDFHTGSPGSFEETTSGVRRAREAGLTVGISTVVTRSNFRHLAEIVRLAAELGAEACHLARVQAYGRAADGRGVPPAALLRPHWEAAVAAAREVGVLCYAGPRAGADVELGARWFAGLGVVDGPRAER